MIIHIPQKYSLSGSEHYFKRLSQELLKLEHDVEIFTSVAKDFNGLRNPSEKDFKPKILTENGLKVHRFPVQQLTDRNLLKLFSKLFDNDELQRLFSGITLKHGMEIPLGSIFSYLENGPITPELYKAVLRRRKEVRVIHATACPYANILTGLLLARACDALSVCTPFYHFENPRYLNLGLYAILREYDLILSNSLAETQFLTETARVPKEKIKQIHMGVDLNQYERAKTSWFYNKYPVVGPMVLFCGHKNYEKGALSILDSIPFVTKQVPDVKFVFIGPSTTAFNRKKAKLKDFSENIINIGVLNIRKDSIHYESTLKRGAFAAADIYAMPSRSEAYGICFLEAWGTKTPVISSDFGAMHSVVRDGVDGYRVPFADPRALAEKIIFLLQNPQIRSSMGKKGYEKIKHEDLTWKGVAKKIEQLYLSHSKTL